MLRRKKKQELPPMPPVPQKTPAAFNKRYGEYDESEEDSEEEEQETDQWELLEIPPTERRLVLRNKVTGEEMSDLEEVMEYLNNGRR